MDSAGSLKPGEIRSYMMDPPQMKGRWASEMMTGDTRLWGPTFPDVLPEDDDLLGADVMGGGSGGSGEKDDAAVLQQLEQVELGDLPKGYRPPKLYGGLFPPPPPPVWKSQATPLPLQRRKTMRWYQIIEKWSIERKRKPAAVDINGPVSVVMGRNSSSCDNFGDEVDGNSKRNEERAAGGGGGMAASSSGIGMSDPPPLVPNTATKKGGMNRGFEDKKNTTAEEKHFQNMELVRDNERAIVAPPPRPPTYIETDATLAPTHGVIVPASQPYDFAGWFRQCHRWWSHVSTHFDLLRSNEKLAISHICRAPPRTTPEEVVLDNVI